MHHIWCFHVFIILPRVALDKNNPAWADTFFRAYSIKKSGVHTTSGMHPARRAPSLLDLTHFFDFLDFGLEHPLHAVFEGHGRHGATAAGPLEPHLDHTV